jgi:ABC-type Na+ efflux pump permease subunit
MKSVNEYCKILGIDSTATPEDLKKAYRDLVKHWHPDQFQNNSRLQSNAQEKLQEINEAYRQLQPVILKSQKSRSSPSKEPKSRATAGQRRVNNPRPQRTASKFKPPVKRHVAAWRKTQYSIRRIILLTVRDPWLIIIVVMFMFVLGVILDWFC